MKIRGIDHVVIVVRDMEKAAAFFSELLETQFEEMEPPEGIAVRTAICAEGIELISPTASQGPVALFLENKGEGLYGISFRVDSTQAAADDIKKKGIRIIGRVEKEKLGSVSNMKELFLHPKDAHGVHILLTEYETMKQ